MLKKTSSANNDSANEFDSFKSDEESINLNESNVLPTKDVPPTKEGDVEEPNYEINSWDDLNISPELLRGIFSADFEKPSPIQRKAIKPMLLGKDVIAQAQSGTGKTATFTIGALSHVDVTSDSVQVLVLSPTRELSTQTGDVFIKIGSMMKGLKIQTLVGGTLVEDDTRCIKANVPQMNCYHKDLKTKYIIFFNYLKQIFK